MMMMTTKELSVTALKWIWLKSEMIHLSEVDLARVRDDPAPARLYSVLTYNMFNLWSKVVLYP